MIVKNWIERIIDKLHGFLKVGIVGSVGYENPPDAWKYVKVGQRMNKVLTYTSTLAASSSYTSSSTPAQDGAGNNYTQIRLFLYQEGSTNTTAKIQQSDDNSNWYDVPNQSVTLTANGATVIEADVFLDYIRVVEENNDSANAQTANKLVVHLL